MQTRTIATMLADAREDKATAERASGPRWIAAYPKTDDGGRAVACIGPSWSESDHVAPSSIRLADPDDSPDRFHSIGARPGESTQLAANIAHVVRNDPARVLERAEDVKALASMCARLAGALRKSNRIAMWAAVKAKGRAAAQAKECAPEGEGALAAYDAMTSGGGK